MITFEIAAQFAQEWLTAWNQRDLDAIMSHYAEDVEFWSPLIAKRLGIASGKISSKSELRAYFARGLAAYPDLHFTLLQVLAGVDTVTFYYRREDGAEVAEMMALDSSQHVIMARSHYSASSGVWKA